MVDVRPANGSEVLKALRQAAAERILVLDGAMGTEIQNLKLSEADFRGERFRGHNHDLRGNNDLYLQYLDTVRSRGIEIPIVPGILPVQNFKQAKSFAERAGASVPEWLAARFEGLEQDVETRKLIAAAVAAEQVLDLVDRGVTEFHFYTMNRADLVYAICHLLGLRAQAPEAVEKAAA